MSLAPALIGQISDIRQIGIRTGTMGKCSLADPFRIAELPNCKPQGIFWEQEKSFYPSNVSFNSDLYLQNEMLTDR